MYAILAYAILNVLLFFGAAILSTCSNVHAIMTNAIIGPALLSGHPFCKNLNSSFSIEFNVNSFHETFFKQSALSHHSSIYSTVWKFGNTLSCIFWQKFREINGFIKQVTK